MNRILSLFLVSCIGLLSCWQYEEVPACRVTYSLRWVNQTELVSLGGEQDEISIEIEVIRTVSLCGQDTVFVEPNSIEVLFETGEHSGRVNGALSSIMISPDSTGSISARWCLQDTFGNQTLSVSFAKPDLVEKNDSIRIENGNRPLNISAFSYNCYEFVDRRESSSGKIFDLELYGMQCWMSENQSIGSELDKEIPAEHNEEVEKYCYDDQSESCLTLGGLYTWEEAMGYVEVDPNDTTPIQGICPDGWHIPSDKEWQIFEREVLGLSEEEVIQTDWRGADKRAGHRLIDPAYDPNFGDTGFKAKLGGRLKAMLREYEGINQTAYFWTSTPHSIPRKIWARQISIDEEGIRRFTVDKGFAFSCRCIRD